MNRIEKLKNKVDKLYGDKNIDRAEWADWLYQNHLFVVVENGKKLVNRFGGNEDIVVAASMLHDIADAIMARENPGHEEQSKKIAKNLLEDCDFTQSEIEVIVDDAMEFHGCKNGRQPKSLEGKIMATADALAHLRSSFYYYAFEKLSKSDSVQEIKNWALPKIERDYHNKIFFEAVRHEIKDDYERAKAIFQD